MDMKSMKAKAKEATEKVVDFIRQHKKEIVLGTVIAGGLVYALSNSDDEENEYVYEYECDEEDNNIDSNSSGEVDENLDNQKQMDPPKRFIGGIDATGSRLKNNEKRFLEEFTTQYDRFRGKEETVSSKYTDWSSDGKYTRHINKTHSFGKDKMSIRVDESYKDDDGQTGSYSSPVEMKARSIINYVKENKELKMFDDVRDIVDLL